MWMALEFPDYMRAPFVATRAVGIAIPARNEAQLIEQCLRALDVAASHAAPVPVNIMLLVNNSSDATAENARSFVAKAMKLVVVERQLAAPFSHAGGARRAAFEALIAMLPDDAVIMTTDADSVVDARWIIANLGEIAAGADAVAGVVTFDDQARTRLPLLPGRALEWRLAGLQARLATLLDPRAHDPWPNHIWAWGASLAITVDAYRRMGGVPAIPLAEDRAMAEAIEQADLRLRRSHAPVVYTSPRRAGRAPGGFADLLDAFATEAGAPCDAALEPTADLVRRLRWRARLRSAFATGGARRALADAHTLEIDDVDANGFGDFWRQVEASAPRLARRRVSPTTLGVEVERAERVIKSLEEHPADSPSSVRHG